MSLFLQVGKKTLSPNGEPIPFMSSLALAAVAGFSGGIVGTPGDMINVRMQNDIKLPADQRRKWVTIFNIFYLQSNIWNDYVFRLVMYFKTSEIWHPLPTFWKSELSNVGPFIKILLAAGQTPLQENAHISLFWAAIPFIY